MASASLTGWSSLAIFSCRLNSTAASSASHSAICLALIFVDLFPENISHHDQTKSRYNNQLEFKVRGRRWVSGDAFCTAKTNVSVGDRGKDKTYKNVPCYLPARPFKLPVSLTESDITTVDGFFGTVPSQNHKGKKT